MPAKRKKKTNKQREEDTADLSLKDQGNRCFAQQRFKEAVELFTKAIEEDPSNHVLYSNRSAAFSAMQEGKLALDDAEKVIELKSDWPKGFLRRGIAFEALYKYPEAHASFQEGLKMDPEDATLTKKVSELSALLDELKLTQDQLDVGENPDVDRFEQMVTWLRDGGGQFPKLYLKYYSDDYRGVHCLTKVPEDDTILYVPFKYIMTSEVAKASAIGKSIISSNVDLRSKHSYLASYVLQEKKQEKSFWDPYINILPQHYANMPIFFGEEHLALLRGSFTLEKIADRIDSLRIEYDNIRRAVPEFNKFSHEEFVWARLVVITRIFGMAIDSNKTDGLVPYADMLNHRVPKETKWTFDDSRYGFIITSLKSIQRGEQVYDSYGRKCNSRFFVNYGFSLDENEDNEAVVRIGLPENDPHYAMKIRFLGGREINAKREFQIPGSYREKKTKELFSFLRFIHAKDSELMLLGQSDGFKLDDIEPISLRNETKVLEHLATESKRMLARFDSTYEEDLKLIDSGELPEFSNKRNCVIMRTGEKRVLDGFVQLADKCIPFLKLPWKDLKRVAAKCSHGTTPYDFYVSAVVTPLVKKAN
jgi:histone-lysine N-methyltransferase SETD3